jgi:hypothetical protein
MTKKTTAQLFEDGFVLIATGSFRLRNEGKYQEAYDELGYIIDMLMQDRQEIREKHDIKI